MTFDEKKLNLRTVRIRDLSRGGAGVARDDDGRVVFVPLSAPGDLLEVHLVEEKKKYATGEIVRILEPSPERVAPRCEVFGKCGGCEWQHLPYEAQWRAKALGVRHALDRVKVVFSGEIREFPATRPYGYRNRIQLRGTGPKIGYYARGTNALVGVETCPIAAPEINATLPRVQKEGVLQFGLEPYKVEIQAIGGQTRHFFNRRHGAGGFRQVNDEQNENLRRQVRHLLLESESPKAEVLCDLFGGEGNLSEGVWGDFRITHVVDQGVRGQGAKARFHSSDVSAWWQSWAREGLREPTAVIADPPREGWPEIARLGETFESPLLTQLILVGCEPDAWARDVSRLTQRGWVVASVAAFDFFPQTHHVEALAQLRRPSALR